MPVRSGRFSATIIASTPITAGSRIAPMSMATRTQLMSTKGGNATPASSSVPTNGTSTPITSTIQASEPKTMTTNSVCRLCGTLPNSRIVAQPSVVFRIRPAKRPSRLARPAKIAIADDVGEPPAVKSIARRARTYCNVVRRVGFARGAGCFPEPRRGGRAAGGRGRAAASRRTARQDRRAWVTARRGTGGGGGCAGASSAARRHRRAQAGRPFAARVGDGRHRRKRDARA